MILARRSIRFGIKVYYSNYVKIGINSNLLLWFESYLSKRWQQVVINGKASTLLTIGARVPQGSILGPLSFLIYINDLVYDIDSWIKRFADDTSLYVIADNEFDASVQLIVISIR